MIYCTLSHLYSSTDGGELELYPFPALPVTISPIFNRLVLFSSTNMLHRVLPSHKKRFCATLWFSKTSLSVPYASSSSSLPRASSPPAHWNLNPEQTDAFHLLNLHRTRKVLCKYFLKDEWLNSIVQSHPSASAEILLQQHLNDVQKIKEIFGPRRIENMEQLMKRNLGNEEIITSFIDA
jgi:hypothetical protein